MTSDLRLLWFNLAVDADSPIQGFNTDWINTLAPYCAFIDVVTMRTGRIAVADNVRVFSVGKEKGYSEARRAGEFYRILTGLLAQRHYDACFAHMQPLFALMGAPLLSLRGVPITLWYAHKAVNLRLRLAEQAAFRVVTSSPEGFRIHSPKVRIVGQGIDTKCFVPGTPPEGEFTILSVSRIAPVKRLETIIETASLLAQDSRKFRLRIVGSTYPHDEWYAQNLRALADAYNLDDVVNFPGEVPHQEIMREFQQAHLMVNVSSTGSVDKAVLEAMACGLPVITANEAFQPILAPWRDRLLVPMDAPAELAAKIRSVMRMSDENRRALGRELRDIVVRDHSLDRLAAVLVEVFRSGELPT